MKLMMANPLFKYCGRFVLVFLATYAVASGLFLAIQEALPASERVVLDFLKPYRSLDLMQLIAQAIRAAIMALVLYPFYELIVRNKNGWLLLFGALWGIALLGSLEPFPGSIEGMIYTKTTFLEHFLVIITSALQIMLFCWVFLHWENRSNLKKNVRLTHKDLPSYLKRFTLLHLIVYWVVGSIFYQVAGYEEALATMELFEHWRSLESITMVAVVFFGQIARGIILALLLYPFYLVLLPRKNRWLLLFGLLFGLKVLGSPIFIAEFIESSLMMDSVNEFMQSVLIGVPEIISQTLLFSILFFAWERKKSTQGSSPTR